MVELLFSAAVSLLVWSRWNWEIGALDEVFAYVAALGCMSFALMRGGVCLWSLVFWLLAIAVFIAESCAPDFLDTFQRWPHLIFRMFGYLGVFTALNGGLLVSSTKQLFAVLGCALVIFFGYVFLEVQILHPLGPDGFFPWTDYLAGVARCAISAVVGTLCCLHFLRSNLAVSDLDKGDQGAGLYSRLLCESSEQLEKGKSNSGAYIDSSVTMHGA